MGSGADFVGSRNEADSGADSVGSWNGAGSGADCVGALEWTAWASGTERALG